MESEIACLCPGQEEERLTGITSEQTLIHFPGPGPGTGHTQIITRTGYLIFVIYTCLCQIYMTDIITKISTISRDVLIKIK